MFANSNIPRQITSVPSLAQVRNDLELTSHCYKQKSVHFVWHNWFWSKIKSFLFQFLLGCFPHSPPLLSSMSVRHGNDTRRTAQHQLLTGGLTSCVNLRFPLSRAELLDFHWCLQLMNIALLFCGVLMSWVHNFIALVTSQTNGLFLPW